MSKKKPPKEQRLYRNLRKACLEFVTGRAYAPMTKRQLIQRLEVLTQHRDLFDTVLQDLVKDKELTLKKMRYHYTQAFEEVLSGTLRVHPRGFGFLVPDDPVQFPQDIFIPKHLTQNAVDGDRVEAIAQTVPRSTKGPEGRVIGILSRARSHLAGIVVALPPYGDPIGYVPLLGADRTVSILLNENQILKVGDRLVMEVVEWGDDEGQTVCRMSHYIGHIADASCDVIAAIEEYQLRDRFSLKQIEEAKTFGTSVKTSEITGREDFRKWETFTIDPTTAKDFDDALTLRKDRKGNYHLAVHIADVSHYVQPGTSLDREAYRRCNSTYFPNTCLPMLPPELSENLCSLKSNVNRLTVSVLMTFNPKGELQSYEIVRGVIRSKKRFTYEEAKEVLDGKVKSPHAKALKLMVELCRLLKKQRYLRGSIEFSLPELRIIIGDDGEPVTTEIVEYDVTHQLVEEFMLKANEVVATHLTNQGKNLPFRVHDQPSEDNLKDFSAIAKAFGFNLPEKPTARDCQKMFDEAAQTSYGQYLASCFIRRMRLAEYSPRNIGHYGLSLTHYCHFTSPIRRYVDLVAHRLLFGGKDELKHLTEIAHRCSEQERISAKAENSVLLLKKLRLLKKVHDAEPLKQYAAVVTRVKPFGIFFEIPELLLDGFLHISNIGNDFYVFEDVKQLLKGSSTGHTFLAGDEIFVMLKDIDFICMETEWHMVEAPGSKAKRH